MDPEKEKLENHQKKGKHQRSEVEIRRVYRSRVYGKNGRIYDTYRINLPKKWIKMVEIDEGDHVTMTFPLHGESKLCVDRFKRDGI